MENKVVKFDQYLAENNLRHVKCMVNDFGRNFLEIKLFKTDENYKIIEQDFLLCFDVIYFSGELDWNIAELLPVASDEKTTLIKSYLLNKHKHDYLVQSFFAKYEMLKFQTNYDTFIYISAAMFIVSQISMSEAQKTYEGLKSINSSDAMRFYHPLPEDVTLSDVEHFANVIRDISPKELVKDLTIEFKDRITSMYGYLELLKDHAETKDRWISFVSAILMNAEFSILDYLPVIQDYLETNQNKQDALPNNFGNNSPMFKDLPPLEVIRIYIDELAEQLLKIMDYGKVLIKSGYDVELLEIMHDHVKKIIMLRNELASYVEPSES